MQKNLSVLILCALLTFLSANDSLAGTPRTRANMPCSIYLNAPCYDFLYYPGIYQDDIAYDCAQQIAFYQGAYTELQQIKNFLNKEPAQFKRELNTIENRILSLTRALGALRVRRDTLFVKFTALTGVISQGVNGTGAGYVTGTASGSSYLSSLALRYARTIRTYQTTLDRYALRLAELQAEIVALRQARTLLIQGRAAYLAQANAQYQNLWNSYLNTKLNLEVCASTVINSGL
jgi:hypothetical protein